MRRRSAVTNEDRPASAEGRFRWGRLKIAAGTCLLLAALSSLTFFMIALSRATLEAPSPTLLLRDRHGRFLGESGAGEAEDFGYWPLDKLPRRLVAPTLAIEDRRFRRHPGGIINSDERYLGPVLPRVALANSRNVPAANLLAAVGLDEGYELLGDLGLHDGGEPARRYGLDLAIGGLPVTLEALVRAYTVLAGDGRLRDLVWYRRQPRGWEPRLLAEATARQVTLFLADPQARLPTFPRMGWSEFPFAVAVKTGTSSRYREAWTSPGRPAIWSASGSVTPTSAPWRGSVATGPRPTSSTGS